MNPRLWAVASLAIGVLWSGPILAYNPDRPKLAHEVPEEIQGVGITEKLGEFVDMSIPFQNEKGEAVTLGRYFSNKPVLFSIVYYNCPSLCNLHLNGVLDVAKKLKWTAGKDFEVVAVSMNHRETPALASAKKASYMKVYGRPEGEGGWHFLTGTEQSIQKVADQVGFAFKWLEGRQEYSHASAAIIMTPGGKISRYLHGIEFSPSTMKLALLEASDGKIGSVLDQVLMYCFQFDPSKNRYTIYAMNIMRLFGTLTVLVLGILLIPAWIRRNQSGSTTA